MRWWRPNTHSRVVAFEPGYANFARLCDNIRLNGCQHAIVPVPLPARVTNSRRSR